jgi:hypothetical protein
MDLKLYKVDLDTPIYRYISLSQFLAFIEKKRTYLTNISVWDDPYEDVLKRLPVKNSPYQFEKFRTFRSYFAQSWSLNGNSDAMWRIYSKNNEGLLLKSTVKKFKAIQNIDFGLFGRVVYFDDIRKSLAKVSKQEPKGPKVDTLKWSLLKRQSFDHEKEVRFITLEKYINFDFEPESNTVELNLNPHNFLDDVIIDPRAPSWYVDTVKKYCEKNELQLTPRKSKLYQFDHSDISDLKVDFPRAKKIDN